MSRLAKTFVFVTSISLLTLLVFPVAAKLEPITGANLGIPEEGNLKDIIINIINVGLGLVALGAAVYIMFAGIRYIMSHGDETATEKAKKGVLYAVIGLIVVALAALIVNFTLSAIPGGGGGGGGGGGNQNRPPARPAGQ